jgi:hypothetical protein
MGYVLHVLALPQVVAHYTTPQQQDELRQLQQQVKAARHASYVSGRTGVPAADVYAQGAGTQGGAEHGGTATPLPPAAAAAAAANGGAHDAHVSRDSSAAPAASAGDVAQLGSSSDFLAAESTLLQLFKAHAGLPVTQLMRLRRVMQALRGLPPGDERVGRFWLDYEVCCLSCGW